MNSGTGLLRVALLRQAGVCVRHVTDVTGIWKLPLKERFFNLEKFPYICHTRHTAPLMH